MLTSGTALSDEEQLNLEVTLFVANNSVLE